LFTIALRIIYDVWSGRIDLANSYILWLISSATGLAILFPVIARTISKGDSDNIFIRIVKFIRKNKNIRIPCIPNYIGKYYLSNLVHILKNIENFEEYRRALSASSDARSQ
jgi:hypothetical protein